MADPTPSEETAPPLARADLERLHREGLLDAEAYRSSLSLWDATRHWRAFTTHWLTILGATFLLVGILFFFAYNWKDLHRFARFGVLQGGVLLTALAAAWTLRGSPSEKQRLPGELLLIAAAVLTGILIAVYGQAYQTGADAFQNFLTWAALIIPWTLVARSAPLWILWLAILQTGMIFFWTQVMGPTGAAGFALLWLLLGLLSLAATAAREFLSTKPAFDWLSPKPIRYLLATATLTWLSFSAFRLIVYEEYTGAATDAIGTLVFVACVLFSFWHFRLRDYDLGVLLLATLFSATLVVCAIVRLMIEGNAWNDAGGWLLLALFTLGIYGGAGFGLQQIHRAHREGATS